MRTFEKIKQELELKKFLYSENGTLHFPSDISKRILVRHFDGKIPTKMIPVYTDITKALEDFVTKNEALSSLVVIQQPFEIGSDFIARIHHVYYVSIDSYYDEDEDCEIPPQFDQLKAIISDLQKEILEKSDKILLRIIENSFVKPTFKTYFDYNINKFINVDPKMDIDDLKEWQAAVEVDC